MAEKSVVGDLIHFRGLVYNPINEQGVVFLFGKVAQDLNMYVEEIKPGFPDCIGRRFNGKGWEEVRIEFEFVSSNFKLHKHEANDCDLIICWEHDWPDCPLEVISLMDIIPGLPNPKVTRPDTAKDVKQENDLQAFLAGIDPNVRTCYQIVDEAAKSLSDEIWAKFNGKDMVTYYSPKRVFLYVAFRKKKGVRLTLFTRGEPFEGVKQIDYEKGGAKWGLFMVTAETQAAQVRGIVEESFRRNRAAIEANENTCWYAKMEEADDDADDSVAPDSSP